MNRDRICVLVLAIIWRGDESLRGEGYDPAKRQTFYRPLNGGVSGVSGAPGEAMETHA
jgi:hypothetical protein